MKDHDYDNILNSFNKRYHLKKRTNLIISVIIVLFGTTSFVFGLRLEPSVTIFRWMTVDGTVFTTLVSFIFVIVNVGELLLDTEMTAVWIYYIRLSMAVVESVIFIVVMFSQLPFFGEHIPVFDRYDSFVMHILIPVIGVFSFLVNDPPIGRLSPKERLQGTWFITYYAVNITILISSGVLSSEMIPYFFLDYRNNPWWLTLLATVFIYGCGYLMGWLLSELNRRLSWLWFKNIA